jgi:hypothetical protein
MASTQVTVNPGAPSILNLPSFSGRIVVTVVTGTTEVWCTTDGTLPIEPSATILTTPQVNIPGIPGQQAVLSPVATPFPLKAPQLQFASTGVVVLNVEW